MSIPLKHFNTSPARLHRMLMRQQPYDLNMVCQPDAEMYIADALSRLSGEDQDEIAGLEVTIHEISSQFTSSRLEEIRTTTDEDDELRGLKEDHPCLLATVKVRYTPSVAAKLPLLTTSLGRKESGLSSQNMLENFLTQAQLHFAH